MLSEPPPSGRQRTGPGDADLVKLVHAVVAATEPQVTHRAIVALANAARIANRTAGVFNDLVMSGPGGARLALEFLSRIPDPLSINLVVAVVPVLKSKLPANLLRLHVAGRLLSSVPDDPQAVTPIVRSLTDGLSKSKALERMLQLQSRVATCQTLDVMIEAAEARSRLRCPRCPARLTRFQFIPHLWAKHRMVYEHGHAIEPRALLDALVTDAATGSDVALVDYTYFLSRQYYPDVPTRQVFQALASRSSPDPTQIDQLLDAATKDHAGLCPVCLTAVQDPIPLLAPEAALANGRLSAEGYGVEVRDTARGQIATVTRPNVEPDDDIEFGPRRPPRLVGVLSALPIVFIAMVAVFLVPKRVVSPLLVATVLGGAAWLIYLVGRYLSKPLPDRSERALALAWSSLTSGVGRSDAAIRFLTRLSRVSISQGNAIERSPAVYELVEHAAVLADKGPTQMQLFAAARVLQVFDGGEMGRERVVGLANLFEPFLRGELPPVFAEAAAEIVLTCGRMKPGEPQRLGILLIGRAFEAGLQPIDVITVTRYCPWFRQLVLGATAEHLALLHVVWTIRTEEAWSNIGNATTVFDYAENFATESRKVLGEHPDTLLRIEFPDALEAELGPVVLTARGLAIGGSVLADPDSNLEMVRAGSGIWRLQFGPYRIPMNERLTDRLLVQFRNWLRYRAFKLVPAAEQSAPTRPGPRTVVILNSLAVPCPLCNTVCIHRAGRIGTPWQALKPS